MGYRAHDSIGEMTYGLCGNLGIEELIFVEFFKAVASMKMNFAMSSFQYPLQPLVTLPQMAVQQKWCSWKPFIAPLTLELNIFAFSMNEWMHFVLRIACHLFACHTPPYWPLVPLYLCTQPCLLFSTVCDFVFSSLCRCSALQIVIFIFDFFHQCLHLRFCTAFATAVTFRADCKFRAILCRFSDCRPRVCQMCLCAILQGW